MPPKISDAAIDLIVREEVSDPAYYARHYSHFEWPEGASGPTVGIGYDCGYCTPGQIHADWTGIIDENRIKALIAASGKRGEAAHAWVREHGKSVTITWDEAMAQFREREAPKWIGEVARALPNTDALSPDCLGALVSLAYNRGPSFNAPGPRYAEMRAIRLHMMNRDFDQIPHEFRSMKRLWTGGVAARREHEAVLFENGLKSLAEAPSEAPLTNRGAEPETTPLPAPGPAMSDPDREGASLSELRPQSRKLRMLRWGKVVLAFFGVSAAPVTLADTLSTITTLKTELSDVYELVGHSLGLVLHNPWFLGAALVCILGVVALELLEALHVQDYLAGRWVPSGATSGSGARIRDNVAPEPGTGA